MVFLAFCLFFANWNGYGLKNTVYAAGKKRDLDFLEGFFKFPHSEKHQNIFFIEDQNSGHLESMKRILYRLNFDNNVFLDPESGEEANFLRNSKKLLFPLIEYARINPTKFRLRIHRAQNNFPLILNEIYHNEWTVYLKPWHPESDSVKEQNKKLEKTSSPFAVPTAVRNNNLPRGEIWETWFPSRLETTCRSDEDKKKTCFAEDPEFWNVDSARNAKVVNWPELFHWKVNGYANSWWLDLELLKKFPAVQGQNDGFYRLHPDGSVDFEIVIEFWPQRLFYLGIIISGIVVSLCAGFLLFHRFSFSIKRQSKNA